MRTETEKGPPESFQHKEPPFYFKLYTKIRPIVPLLPHLTHISLIDLLYYCSLDSRIHKKVDSGSIIFMLSLGLVLNKTFQDIFTVGYDFKAIMKQILMEVKLKNIKFF